MTFLEFALWFYGVSFALAFFCLIYDEHLKYGHRMSVGDLLGMMCISAIPLVNSFAAGAQIWGVLYSIFKKMTFIDKLMDLQLYKGRKK